VAIKYKNYNGQKKT